MKYGLIGEKLSHSLSPDIHRIFFELTGKKGDYGLFELSIEELQPFLLNASDKGFKGLNVTIPYKTKVISYINELSKEAMKIGAVNTIVPGNMLKGYNTDYYGIDYTLRKYHESFYWDRALVLGSGGAANAVITYLEDNKDNEFNEEGIDNADKKDNIDYKKNKDNKENKDNANKNEDYERNESNKYNETNGINEINKRSSVVSKIYLASRDKIAAKNKFPHANTVSYDEIADYSPFDIIVNTTPVGMFPSVGASPLTKEQINGSGFLFDLIYNPAKTRLMELSNELGIPNVNGLYMLVAQAVKAQEIWNGEEYGQNLVDAVYLEILEERA
jgi:shikimate dehydrogenase